MEKGELERLIREKKLIYKFKEEINYKIKKSSKIEEYNIEEGFEYIKNNENDAFSNFNRYDDLYRSKNWEEAMKIIENNLDIFAFNNRTKNKWKEFLIIINTIFYVI